MRSPETDLVILLGAGASVAAGMPSTSEITGRVLSGEEIVHHSDELYYLGSPNPRIPDGWTWRAAEVASLAAELVRRRWPGMAFQPTYEDVYYLLEQLDDDRTEEYENPALEPMKRVIDKELAGLLLGKERESRPLWTVDELIHEAKLYVRDVAWRLLQRHAPSPKNLSLLSDLCRQEGSGSVEIFTLNHDVALETHLRTEGVEFADGFGEPQGDVRYWQPEIYDRVQHRVRLYKLHGSIDWFRFEHGPAAVGIPIDGDQWHSHGPDGRMQWPLQARPLILCSTFNKILRYQSPPFAELHMRLMDALRTCRTMLIVGYGFRDKAINTHLLAWMSDEDARTVIVHPDPDELTRGARPALGRGVQRWREDGRLTFIERGLENADLSTVGPELGLRD